MGRNTDIEGAIAAIDSDKDDPRQFRVDGKEGYVYMKGKGTVTLADGKTIALPAAGVRFRITFTRANQALEIRDLKVIAECEQGTGKIGAAVADPIEISPDNTFTFLAGQGSSGTGKFTSADSAGDEFRVVSGKWTAGRKKG